MARYIVPPKPALGQATVPSAFCPYCQKLQPIAVMEIEQFPNNAQGHWVCSSEAFGPVPDAAPLGTLIPDEIYRPPEEAPIGGY